MLREIDFEKLLLVICLTVLIVAGLNALAYAALRRGDEANMIELTRKAAQRARNPWKDEEMALQELSRLVTSLKENEAGRQETGNGEAPAENHAAPGDS
jgi:hypothetical protein